MYLVQTVQTSWRPQLPLPKEVPNDKSSDMDRHHHSRKDTSTGSMGSAGKKWSLGRFFRKKKDELETESSSEDDRKAGFSPSNKPRRKDKQRKRSSKVISDGFDHIVIAPKENEIFVPCETYPEVHQQPHHHQQLTVRSSGSLDRRSRRDRKMAAANRSAQQCPHTSSEDEIISLDTSLRYRSDESLGSQALGNCNGSRRSRTARNERYYKRLSRDGECSNGGYSPMMQMPPPAPAIHQRWNTQPAPLSIFNGPPQHTHQIPVHHHQGLKTSSSLTHMANLNHGYNPTTPPTNWYPTASTPKIPVDSVSNNLRSVSFDNHIHLQNHQNLPYHPPPPPPRDPQRRMNVGPPHPPESRPISYAFDQTAVPPQMHTMNGRCVSDDKLWGPNANMYQSSSSIHRPASTQPPPVTCHQPPAQPNHRRFITRADRDAQPGKKSCPTGLDFKYVAEATPRSRKPISVVDDPPPAIPMDHAPYVNSPIRTTKSGLPSPSPNLTASDFWKRIDEANRPPIGRGREPDRLGQAKPRSVSSSRAGEMRAQRMPIYSNLNAPNQPVPYQPNTMSRTKSTDEVDHVVNGSLLIKPTRDLNRNYVEIRTDSKSNSMPNYYQQRHKIENILRPNKVASPQVQQVPQARPRPVEVQGKTVKVLEDEIVQKKQTNLEDAINELEAIYKSLKLSDDGLLERADRRDIPTPDFDKYAQQAEYLDDEESPTGEPDIVLDDMANRTLKHANSMIKIAEKQPPFGIPILPIPPSPRSDYLHVQPDKDSKKVRCSPHNYPDIVTDDLAVRSLRKDPPGRAKPFMYPSDSLRKKRATRTQSANIYSLIQEAAKPSGGNVKDYFGSNRNLEKSGSLSDFGRDLDDDDIPSPLQLLQSLKTPDGSPRIKSLPFRHPNQGGAILNLPKVLAKSEEKPHVKGPVPLPRKSISPDPERSRRNQMEDALNQIAKDAKESSEKLNRDLRELRKEALTFTPHPSEKSSRYEKNLADIENVSEAAKKCEEILLETVPAEEPEKVKPRKLQREDKLIQAIDQVSVAANKVCEKILKEIVTTAPPVVVQTALKVKNEPKEPKETYEEKKKPSKNEELVIPSLIQKLDTSSSTSIGAIAARCMRQISELGDMKDTEVSPDYDNLATFNFEETKNACKTGGDKPKSNHENLLVVLGQGQDQSSPSKAQDQDLPKKQVQEEEEIDKIMKECEAKARSAQPDDVGGGQLFICVEDKSSSSDCLRSSSPTTTSLNRRRQQSSSITSFNPYSSSDYVKSPSSEYQALSTDPIKTFSTTSYDVKSTSATPNMTSNNSPFSCTPSPPLNLTPIGNDVGSGSDPSQYNSTEELAMIFGIEKSSTPPSPPVLPTTVSTSGKSVQTSSDIACDDNKNSCVVLATTNPPCSPSKSPTKDLAYFCVPPPKHESPILIKSRNRTISSSSPLDTIPEVLDDSDSDLVDGASDDVFISSRLNEGFLNYSSQINIIITSADDDEVQCETQLDSLSSCEESNPDSGNVSLSDFPVQGQANSSVELSLSLNSRYEVSKSFVNEVHINTEVKEDDVDFVDVELNETLTVHVDGEVGQKESSTECLEEEELIDQVEESQVGENELNETFEQDIKTDKNEVDTEINENLTNDDLTELNVEKEFEKIYNELEESELNEIPSTSGPKLEMNITYSELEVIEEETEDSFSSIETVDSVEIEKLNDSLSKLNEPDSNLRERSRPSTSNSPDSVPTSNESKSSSLTLFAQPTQPDSGLTFLEHLALACTVGIINNQDLYTFFIIVIAVITIIALILL